jgi:hypothetical protein
MSRKRYFPVSRLDLGRGLSIDRQEMPDEQQDLVQVADGQAPDFAAIPFVARSMFWNVSPCQTALSSHCAADDSTIRVAWRDAIESRVSDRKLMSPYGKEVIIPAWDEEERRKMIEASPWPKSGTFLILISRYIPPSDSCDGQKPASSDSEVMCVTDASQYPWPVRRGLAGTRAVHHFSGALVSMRTDREDRIFQAALDAIRERPGHQRAALMSDLGRWAIEDVRWYFERRGKTSTGSVRGENFTQELLEWLTFGFVELHKSSTQSAKNQFGRIMEVGEPLLSILRRHRWLAVGCGDGSEYSPVFLQAMWNTITGKTKTGDWSFHPYAYMGKGLRAGLKEAAKYRLLDLVNQYHGKPGYDDALFYGLREPRHVQGDQTKCRHCEEPFVTADQLCRKHASRRRVVLSLDHRSAQWAEESILQERDVNDEKAKRNAVCESTELDELKIKSPTKLKRTVSQVCKCESEAIENDFIVQSGRKTIIPRPIRQHPGNLVLDKSGRRWICKDCGGLYEPHPKKPKPEPRLFCKTCNREWPAVLKYRAVDGFRWSAANSVIRGRHHISEWRCSNCRMPYTKSQLIQANPKTPLEIERYDALTEYLARLKEFDVRAYEIVKNLAAGKDWQELAAKRKPKPYKDVKNYPYLVHLQCQEVFRIRYPSGIVRRAPGATEVHELNIDRFLRDRIRSDHAEESKRRNYDGRVSLRRRMREAVELDRAGYLEQFAKIRPEQPRKANPDQPEFFDHELERKFAGEWRKARKT